MDSIQQMKFTNSQEEKEFQQLKSVKGSFYGKKSNLQFNFHEKHLFHQILELDFDCKIWIQKFKKICYQKVYFFILLIKFTSK